MTLTVVQIAGDPNSVPRCPLRSLNGHNTLFLARFHIGLCLYCHKEKRSIFSDSSQVLCSAVELPNMNDNQK